MDSNYSSQLIKRCRVCGDQAICFNFDVMTCGPCRLFFYRNVNRFENWTCRFGGNCEIISTNRKGCRKCRMEKCFVIGMKPKLTSKDYTNKSLNQNQNNELTLRNVLEFRDCYDLNQTIKISLPQIVSKNYFEFNQTEIKYIDELIQSSSSIFNFEEANLPVLYEASTIYQAFNTGMHYVRRIIKYCKFNSVFRSLNEQEQLTVLKQFINKFLKIRNSFSYDPQIDGYYALGSEDGNCSVLNKSAAFYNFPDQSVKQLVEYKRMHTILLSEEMANDKTIRDLLIVQELFGSHENISLGESLRYHYWIYNHLLLRYLQCKYRDMDKAQSKYSMLIKLVTESKNEFKLQHFQQVLQTLDRNQFEDLATEIFNI